MEERGGWKLKVRCINRLVDTLCVEVRGRDSGETGGGVAIPEGGRLWGGLACGLGNMNNLIGQQDWYHMVLWRILTELELTLTNMRRKLVFFDSLVNLPETELKVGQGLDCTFMVLTGMWGGGAVPRDYVRAQEGQGVFHTGWKSTQEERRCCPQD